MVSAGRQLRIIREQLGLTMRDVEIASSAIAARRGNDDFSLTLSRLSDIETKGIIPSIYRLYSLAVIYRLDMTELLEMFGIDLGGMDSDLITLRRPTRMLPVAMPQTTVADKIVLKRMIRRGSLGSVWEAYDLQSGETRLAKVFELGSRWAVVKSYFEHLEELENVIKPKNLPGVLLPLQSGFTDVFAYQIYQFFKRRSLHELIRVGSMPLDAKLTILRDTACTLQRLHSLNVIHADIKPENILVDEKTTPAVLIIDFGMARVGAGGNVILFATPRYLPPLLTSSLRDNISGFSELESTGTIGPYIDVYSLGVILFEMLTLSSDVPPVPDEALLKTILEQSYGGFLNFSERVRYSITRLLFRMLAASPNELSISAREIAETCEAILHDVGAVPETYAESPRKQPRIPADQIEGTDLSEPQAALNRIESIARELLRRSAAFISEAGTLRELTNTGRDDAILSEVHAVFDNSLRRTQSSWKLGVAMTVAAFAIIVAMIASATIVTVATHQPFWGIVFGGVGVSALIGTLIWRPFDRIFRATILSQQIEMIHVQTIAGFRGTTDLKERIRVCTDAVASLEALFRRHAIPEPSRKR